MNALRGLWIGVLVSGIALVGCGGDAGEGDEEAAPDTVVMEGDLEEAVEETGEAIGEAGQETGEAVGEAMEETGEAVGEAAEEIGDKAEDAADAVD